MPADSASSAAAASRDDSAAERALGGAATSGGLDASGEVPGPASPMPGAALGSGGHTSCAVDKDAGPAMAFRDADLAEAAARVLLCTDPADKCTGAAALLEALEQGRLAAEVSTAHPVAGPGIPARPQLVDPREVPRRSLGSRAGHAALVHAVCHIEFSAINLALDAVARFAGMPDDYYRDWVRVAAEEAEHFSLISSHLATLGFAYGDLPAHAGLWHTAERSAHDVLVRMALVPRVMEARGLDVTPDMIERLHSIDDHTGAAILTRILEDEVGHVAVGSRWFRYACAERGLPPEETFHALVTRELGGLRASVINRDARLAAGFSADELDQLFPQDCVKASD